MEKAANSSISLKNIKITDKFWNKYIHLVKDVIIPYQWDILNDRIDDVETSHCIENFKIAAGARAATMAQYFRIRMWRNGLRQ